LRKEQFVALSASIPFVSCTENSQALAQNFLLSTRPHDEWRFSFHGMLRFSIGEFDSRLCGNPSIERKYADRRSLPVATDRRVNPTLAAYDSRKNQRWLGGIPSCVVALDDFP
jgi:hypothetical protein